MAGTSSPSADAHVPDAARVKIPPPLWFLLTIIAGVLLAKYFLALPLGLPAVLRLAAAAGAVLYGVGMMFLAVRAFRRTGQDPKPWTSTPAVISTGVYRWSRNPMYVGLALFQGGIGLFLENGWIVLSLPFVLLAVYLTAVRHEEAYLEQKFGADYLDYKASVRRWL